MLLPPEVLVETETEVAAEAVVEEEMEGLAEEREE